MAEDLAAVLRAEGYSVGTGGELGTAVILLPLRGVNKLVAFAADAATLNHVREWARTLDARKEATVENAVFTYEVRNTQAASMQETLEAILEDGGTSAFQGVQALQGAPTGTAEERHRRRRHRHQQHPRRAGQGALHDARQRRRHLRLERRHRKLLLSGWTRHPPQRRQRPPCIIRCGPHSRSLR